MCKKPVFLITLLCASIAYSQDVNLVVPLKVENEEQRQAAHVVATKFTVKKSYVEARETYKKIVEFDQRDFNAHYMLALIWNGTNFRIPAMQAAIRFISLSPDDKRSQNAILIIREALRPGSVSGTPPIGTGPDMFPTDEGDYRFIEALLATLRFNPEKEAKNQAKDELQTALNTTINWFSSDKKLKNMFVGRSYVPFLAEMSKKKFTEVLVQILMAKSGYDISRSWVEQNKNKVDEFFAWAKAYEFLK